jgi:hypothetical protein
VGGDLLLNGGISLFTPLPYLVDKPIKGHLFFNAGNLVMNGKFSIHVDRSDYLTHNFWKKKMLEIRLKNEHGNCCHRGAQVWVWGLLSGSAFFGLR